eukprot:TRINITY_DN2970_c0_g1_i8.p1 TRINITY_DN2970_c0_g1~~TRINITY_DN2970_c0_g1_i8.p1  ORF type:complete len:418 (+),score=65.74 TRINITY_DN2970_c0_g1_i8:169-1422(+)
MAGNKVSHVINCAGKQIPNYWEHLGIKYLTYYWSDKNAQIILDSQDKIPSQCYDFINEALDANESALIHSGRGQNRACIVAALWLMRKHRWTLLKTLEFLNYRKPNLDIRTHFIQQLTAYESRLTSRGAGPKTSKWKDVFDTASPLESEELLLRNTYLNAQTGKFTNFIIAMDRQRPAKVKWNDIARKGPLACFIEPKPHKLLEESKDTNETVNIQEARKQSCKKEEELDNPMNDNSGSKEDMSMTKNSIKEMIMKQKESNAPKSIYEYEAQSNNEKKDKLITAIELATNLANSTPKDPKSHRLIETNSKTINAKKLNCGKLEKNLSEGNTTPQIVNKNYINNYIIQSPRSVKIINYSPENSRTSQSKRIPKSFSFVAKNNAVKKYICFVIVANLIKSLLLAVQTQNLVTVRSRALL